MPSLYQYLNFVTLLTVNIPTLGISNSNTLCSSYLHMVIGQNVRSCTNTRTSVDCILCGQDVFRPPLLYLSGEWRATCTSATCLSWRLFSHTEKWISPPSFWGRTWSCYVRHTASERLFYRIFPMMFGTSFRRQVVVVLTVSRSDTEERRRRDGPPRRYSPGHALSVGCDERNCPLLAVHGTSNTICPTISHGEFKAQNEICLASLPDSWQWGSSVRGNRVSRRVFLFDAGRLSREVHEHQHQTFTSRWVSASQSQTPLTTLSVHTSVNTLLLAEYDTCCHTCQFWIRIPDAWHCDCQQETTTCSVQLSIERKLRRCIHKKWKSRTPTILSSNTFPGSLSSSNLSSDAIQRVLPSLSALWNI